MSYHFSMGAINNITNNYEYPKIATKGKNKYKCPCCEKNVIFKKGQIKQPHFAHYKCENPCCYYEKPNETQIHKDAKMLMKSLLDNKKNIFINRKCNCCEQANKSLHYNIINCDYNENTKAVIEYKFNYNDSNKSADVALLENEKIKYIFEICYKNKTKEENRPEPWVEIDAERLINSEDLIDVKGYINIECIRSYKCDECIRNEENERIRMETLKENERIQMETLKENERIRMEILKEKQEQIKKRMEEERRKLINCSCGIMEINICICEMQKYEVVKLSNNLFCINCNKWKCRC